MSTKTITVTEDAYEALRALKDARESFSDTILRVAKRKPLSSFVGILSNKSGGELEKAIMEGRKIRNEAHKKRMKNLMEDMK